jgi:hypothetical protein
MQGPRKELQAVYAVELNEADDTFCSRAVISARESSSSSLLQRSMVDDFRTLLVSIRVLAPQHCENKGQGS